MKTNLSKAREYLRVMCESYHNIFEDIERVCQSDRDAIDKQTDIKVILDRVHTNMDTLGERISEEITNYIKINTKD